MNIQIMSQREVQRKYNRLMNDVETKVFYKLDLTNRVNCYTCTECHRVTKTKDIDAGVTPFIFECGVCGGEAHSSFYRDIAPDIEPTFEWYRPTLEETMKMRNKPMLLDHILQGGLEVRKIKKP